LGKPEFGLFILIIGEIFMMKKQMMGAALAGALVLIANGCAMARGPVNGFVYSDLHSSVAATSNQAGNRVGEACATSILGIYASGDASIEAARRNGGITLISSVDESSNSYVGVYAKYCTIVRGR
jgi:hypothetical protein